MKTRNIIWTILLLIIGATLVYAVAKSDKTTPGNGNGNGNGNSQPPSEEMITVTSPAAGELVDATNGLTLAGQARGNWYFEATAPVIVYGANGDELARSYITAQGEWMTTEFVPFSGTINPFLTNGQTAGYVQFENSNPSGLEENSRSLRVNIRFASQETQTIKLYYGNTVENPNTSDCSKVYAVERTVPKTTGIAALAVSRLMIGPTNEEASAGYISAFGRGTGNELKSIDIKNGVATADFSVLPPGGSCLVTQARAQIEQTLKQFSTVKSVKILLNGSEDEALQP